MSKLSFRARALDATKSMPVYKAEYIPDLPDFAAINRAVPLMPTGMEKEEESEHHLQRALSAQQVYGTAESLVIPVPEIDDVDEHYSRLYGIGAQGYKPPKAFIHVQPWGMDQEIPDYDMDSEDEAWLSKQSKKLEVTPLKFETMMDRLEKGSGQTVMTVGEAKTLLKEDDDLIIAVYDYWLNKRLTVKNPLIPAVRTEKRDGSTTNNPYVAFRRRTEKMQTRKNRKNDESSYERMLKLRRDLTKALTILELMKRREKSKKEMVKLTIEVSEKRYQMEDWDGKSYGEALAKRHTLPPTYIQPILQQYAAAAASSSWAQRDDGVTYSTKRTKRDYKKARRQHKQQSAAAAAASAAAAAAAAARESRVPQYNDVDILGQGDLYSSEDDAMSPQLSASDDEKDDPDGVFAFRRKPGVLYQAPINNGFGNWPWHGPDEGGIGEAKYRYSLSSLPRREGSERKYRCVGFSRRRVGRGGRVILDRAPTDWDDHLQQVDFNPDAEETGWGRDYRQAVKQQHIHHFRPKTPSEEEELVLHRHAGLFGSSGGQHHSNMDCSLSPSLSTEFNVESFHNHQEQLLQMQRQQQEQILIQDTQAPQALTVNTDGSDILSAGGSQATATKFTLDSASAAFAASAVHNSATDLIQSSSGGTPTTLTASMLVGSALAASTSSFSSASSSGAITNSLLSVLASSTTAAAAVPMLMNNVVAMDVVGADTATAASSGSASPAVKAVAVQHNGPATTMMMMDNNKATNVFSTSPAANVLQLNYPLSSSSSTSSTTSTTSLISTTNPLVNRITAPVAFVSSSPLVLSTSSGPPPQNTVFSKLAAHAHAQAHAHAANNTQNAAAAAAAGRAMAAQKEKHDGSANGSNNLLKDKVMAMEVT